MEPPEAEEEGKIPQPQPKKRGRKPGKRPVAKASGWYSNKKAKTETEGDQPNEMEEPEKHTSESAPAQPKRKRQAKAKASPKKAAGPKAKASPMKAAPPKAKASPKTAASPKAKSKATRKRKSDKTESMEPSTTPVKDTSNKEHCKETEPKNVKGSPSKSTKKQSRKPRTKQQESKNESQKSPTSHTKNVKGPSKDQSTKALKVKATFARRVLPKNDPNRTFHSSVRAAFEKEIHALVSRPSYLEDPWKAYIKKKELCNKFSE